MYNNWSIDIVSWYYKFILNLSESKDAYSIKSKGKYDTHFAQHWI